MQIEIDFDVFKALTNLRESESTTYNEVIRRLLPSAAPKPETPSIPAAPLKSGCLLKGILFPDGTQFRVSYKGKTYTAEIKNGTWVDQNGNTRNSPSDAAHAITNTNVNGWRFWEFKRPPDSVWRIMDSIRPNTVLT